MDVNIDKVSFIQSGYREVSALERPRIPKGRYPMEWQMSSNIQTHTDTHTHIHQPAHFRPFCFYRFALAKQNETFRKKEEKRESERTVSFLTCRHLKHSVWNLKLLSVCLDKRRLPRGLL